MHRRLRTVTLAATALAATLVLTGCDDGSATGSRTPAPAEPSASFAPSAPSAPSSGSTGGIVGGSTNGGSGGGLAAAAKCRTADLGFQLDGQEPKEVSGQGHVTVTLTHKGTAPCSLNGFPGVALKSSSGLTWSLPRQTSVKPRALTLDPGGDAYFRITYLSYQSEGNSRGSEFRTTTFTLTPPGETRGKELKWPHGTTLLHQEAATHPGTFVGPVTDR
jgi:hypothetical protein